MVAMDNILTSDQTSIVLGYEPKLTLLLLVKQYR
jgi:hypothetical protein